MTNVSQVSREALAFQNRKLAKNLVHTDKIDEEMSMDSSSSSSESIESTDNKEDQKEEVTDWTEQRTQEPKKVAPPIKKKPAPPQKRGSILQSQLKAKDKQKFSHFK